jgi:hypothetical protein
MVDHTEMSEEWSEAELTWFDAPTMDNAEVPSFMADRIVEGEPEGFFAALVETLKGLFAGNKAPSASH